VGVEMVENKSLNFSSQRVNYVDRIIIQDYIATECS